MGLLDIFKNPRPMPASADLPFTARLGVTNSRSVPMLVVVEPWAFDYTLSPGEKLMIVAFGSSAPWFHVEEEDDGWQVYCEKTDAFEVLQHGRELSLAFPTNGGRSRRPGMMMPGQERS